MKKVLIAFLPWLFTAFSYKAMAQEDVKTTIGEKEKKENQEIVIRKKGDKDATITIQISGDKVTVNGKPLVEFKDDAITINKRNVIVRDGNKFYGDGLGELEVLGNLADITWDRDFGEFKSSAFLGVTTEKVDKGAKITDITKESAAEKAGLKEGDIITKIGDTKIEDPGSLSEAITSNKPKDEVKISYLRDGKEKSVKATLQERKHSGVFSYSAPDGSFKTLTIPPTKAYGYDLNTTSPRANIYNGDNYDALISKYPRQQKLGLKIQDTEDGNGVKVLDVEEKSAAANAGIKKDDIVTEIGGEKVVNTDEARGRLQDNREKSSYTIKAKRNGTEMSFDIKFPKKLKTANL
jgi:serine protease Do